VISLLKTCSFLVDKSKPQQMESLFYESMYVYWSLHSSGRRNPACNQTESTVAAKHLWEAECYSCL